MAQIGGSYAPPGVYTEETFNAPSPALNTGARIAVLIGEGQEFFTESNVEMHRGSSATADDQVVGENISDQANGQTRSFQLQYFPVVSGNGTGTVSNDPSKIKVTANGIQVPVLTLNGTTGVFTVASLIPAGTDLVVTYFFKKKDTQVLNEDLTAQVPAFAKQTIGALTLSLSIPGALGNNVTLTLTQAATGEGVSDALAVTGQGTDAISIELRKSDNSVRTDTDLVALIAAGIQTQDGGSLTVSGTPAGSALNAQSATAFAGGAGQSTNTVFKVANVPIVDGTNGGVVTTDPTKVAVKVNGVTAQVAAVDGASGLVTLATGVAYGSTLEVTYFTNRYQDTADILPAGNVSSITNVGWGPNASNFIEGVDFVLSGNAISWGAAANTAAGASTPGYTPLDATAITTTLVDERVYLRPVSGAVSGRNSVFTLQDSPVDGSGLGRTTDNPALISVYVGTDPVSALLAGPVKVARLSGASAQVTLYNPPTQGSKVYASYYRSTLNDHVFTLKVKTAGAPGQGSYAITDELSRVAPVISVGTTTVSDANFQNLGIVWPYNFSDLVAGLGGADETVTLSFQDDSLTTTITPAVQASLTVASKIIFRATTPGTSGNSVTVTMVGGPTGAADASAITVAGNDVTVETVKADNSTVRTWQEIVNLFATYPPTTTGGGVLLCTGVTSADLTSQAATLSQTNLAGGAAAVTGAYANRFLVTSSRTVQQAQADGLGLTGGATTPQGANTTTGAVGYVGQTYMDAVTGVKFTLVDPKNALSYGYTQLPSPSYLYKPGDTITFTINREAGHVTGTVPTIAIPGLQTKVVTTLGMNVGDTATIQTFNRAGNSPNVGDYYYVSFTTAKAASDMAIQTFTTKDAAYAAYGQPSIANRLSLAIQLLVANGASQFACIQVPVQEGLGVASDQAFIDAIQSLTMPLAGSGQKVNVIVPLSTSQTVQQYLSSFLTKQATIRNKGEAIGFIGFDQYTSATEMQARAQSIANQRVIAVSANSVGVSLQGVTDQAAVEYAITGEFVATALAGLNLSPKNDVATTLTGQDLVGFTRSLIVYDTPTKNLMAVAGITCLDDNNGALEVRDYLTTDMSSQLTQLPYVTTTADYCNQAFRKMLKQYEGRKATSDLPGTIQATINAALVGWNSNNQDAIISGYGQVTVNFDSSDPTVINVVVPIKPMFSTEYILLNLQVNLTL